MMMTMMCSSTSHCLCLVVTTLECSVVLVMFSVTSVCLSLSDALTVESLDLKSLFLVCSYIVRISRLSLCIKVIRSSSKSQVQSTCPCVSCLWVVRPPSIERESCFARYSWIFMYIYVLLFCLTAALKFCLRLASR